MDARNRTTRINRESGARSRNNVATKNVGIADAIKKHLPQRRDFTLLVLFLIFMFIILMGLVSATLINGPKYAEEAYKKQVPLQTIYAKRGTIYDRNGAVIATTTDAYSVYADPTVVNDKQKISEILQKYFGEEQNRTTEDYLALISKENTSFVYIKRAADAKVGEELKAELQSNDLKGVGLLSESKRVYPYNDYGSQVIGNLRYDENDLSVGNCGLELQYNSVLNGKNGSRQVEYGRDGTPVAMGKNAIVPAQDGEDIIISIDMNLQRHAEDSLLSALQERQAENGSVTILDAKTGEIYTAASFSKQETKKGEGDDATTTMELKRDPGKIWSISDSYEPGSTFKAITAASIFANSDVDASTTFDVPSSIRVGGATITDSHDRAAETMTFENIIARSSNIGTVLAARKITDEQLYNTIESFGFTQKCKTDFPGVVSGYVEKAKDWDQVQAANIAFGQGLTVSGMQLTRAFGAISQSGKLVQPHFLIGMPHNSEKASELMSGMTEVSVTENQEACDKTSEILQSVTEYGTGKLAAVEGYAVSGKTGTAQVVSESGGYASGKHITSFVGYLKGSTNDLVCLVTAQCGGDIDGGTVCAPVFSDIMTFAADSYMINHH